jgi:hypothetical protein
MRGRVTHFLAGILPMEVLVSEEDAVGEHGEEREDPDAGDDEEASLELHPGLEGGDDEAKAVNGDGGERERGNVDASALGVEDQVTEHLPKDPLLEKSVDGGEGDGEGEEENVREGQVRDEEISHLSHEQPTSASPQPNLSPTHSYYISSSPKCLAPLRPFLQDSSGVSTNYIISSR